MNKYKNVKTEINNVIFSSKIEANVYKKLLELETKGEITDLILQPKFILQNSFNSNGYYDGKKEKVISGKIREITYISDFLFKYKNNFFVLEVKGMMDQKYPLKKKMFLEKYGDNYIFMEIRRIRELNKIETLMNEVVERRK